MKEIRDIKIDLVIGNKNPIIDLFCEITSGIEIINCNVYNEEGLEFIYHKDGQWIFYQDAKNDNFWVHYYKYWELFESNFDLKYEEIQAITKYLVEDALKREVGTPNIFFFFSLFLVEDALKREVGTPPNVNFHSITKVEDALKREVGTPSMCYFNVHDGVEDALKREVATPFSSSNFSSSNPRYKQVEDALKRELEK